MEENNLEVVKKNQEFIEKAEKTIKNIKELHDILDEIENGGNK